MLSADAARHSRHEALHAAAAVRLGWPLDAVSRIHVPGADATTHLGQAPPGEPRDLALKKCVVSILPAIDDPRDPGCELDLDEVDVLVRLSGVPLSQVWTVATALLSEPRFRAQVRAVEGVLYERRLLSGHEVRQVMNV